MNWATILSATAIHLEISFLGVLVGCIIGLPLAALLTYFPKLEHGVFIVIDAIQTVPTLAMLTFVMLIFWLNNTTVIVGIALYALFPITRNHT